ncbi:MAG: 50S ribosomal protein L6 [Chloroflexia bacterium]|jgi:large subunit ribosomal protein L6|nr:50S ribosomal protein L6 [Chloroflexia bacterium]MDQ3524311.1 50S ribosomal protein L6 [Chloroflexota bacterium]
MSRIGNQPITVPSGVEITIGKNNDVMVKGPKGELSSSLSPRMTIAQEDGTLTVLRPNDARENKAMHGLTRSLLNNMVVGVTDGYTKRLEIHGVGYRAQMDGQNLVLNVGFSHQVRITPPEGITFSVEANTRVAVTGIDKQMVGEEAAKIRIVRPPEPYKGKGIRYAGEYVRRKAGKAGKAK